MTSSPSWKSARKAVASECLPPQLAIAATAAVLMCSGVSKSGSPVPKSTTSFPCWRRTAVAAVTASVADGFTLPRRPASCIERYTTGAFIAPPVYTGTPRPASATPCAARRASSTELRAQALLDGVRNETADVTAEGHDLLHQPRAGVEVRFPRHHEDGLDRR